MSTKAAPYRPIKVTIVKIKECVPQEMALADASRAAKCIVASDADTTVLKEGSTVIIRNFNCGREVVFCNKATKITHTAPQSLSAERCTEARNILDPPPPVVQQIKDVEVDKKTTILGTVEKVCTQSRCKQSSLRIWCCESGIVDK